MGTTSPWLAGIPEAEEEKASAKDSVTSGLPARGHGEGVEASGLTGQPAVPKFKFGGSFMAGDISTKNMAKTALVPPKEEKGELSMGPMVTSGEKSKDYSALAEESVSLVGKSTGMPVTTSGGFAPHTARVAQMKLEPPLLEMFLDRTDLSKTVDRHGTERCHVLSRSSRFLVAVLFERQPVLVERGPVLTKNG